MDPNDIKSANPEDRPQIAYKTMQSAVEILNYHVIKGDIDDKRRLELIEEEANRLLGYIDPAAVTPANAWMYADLLRTTKRWNVLVPLLEKAVKSAATVDRKVNDSLRLAQALAEMNNVPEAIKVARSVFDVAPDQLAPILPATLYEIVPAALHKGHDPELATLLQDAVACHERVKVDPKTDDGKLFLIARNHHLSRARAKILELSNPTSKL